MLNEVGEVRKVVVRGSGELLEDFFELIFQGSDSEGVGVEGFLDFLILDSGEHLFEGLADQDFSGAGLIEFAGDVVVDLLEEILGLGGVEGEDVVA